GNLVFPANSDSVTHCSYPAANRNTVSSVSRCVLPGRNIPPPAPKSGKAAVSLIWPWLIPCLLLEIHVLLFEDLLPGRPVRVLVIPRAAAARPHRLFLTFHIFPQQQYLRITSKYF